MSCMLSATSTRNILSPAIEESNLIYTFWLYTVFTLLNLMTVVVHKGYISSRLKPKLTGHMPNG